MCCRSLPAFGDSQDLQCSLNSFGPLQVVAAPVHEGLKILHCTHILCFPPEHHLVLVQVNEIQYLQHLLQLCI